MDKSDFLVEAAYNLVGNLQNALCVRGELIYENIDWDKSVYTGTIPTKAEVDAEQQKLLDGALPGLGIADRRHVEMVTKDHLSKLGKTGQ